MIRARMLTSGAAEGPVLSLEEPLSFWGAFEPRTGVILDVHHPQRGACVKDTVLVMTETRGSGSAPGAIAEATSSGALAATSTPSATTRWTANPAEISNLPPVGHASRTSKKSPTQHNWYR